MSQGQNSTRFNSVEELISRRFLNGYINLNRIYLTKEQLDQIIEYTTIFQKNSIYFEAKLYYGEFKIVEDPKESNIKIE